MNLNLDDLVDVTIRGARLVGTWSIETDVAELVTVDFRGHRYMLKVSASDAVIVPADVAVWAKCQRCPRRLQVGPDGQLPVHEIRDSPTRSPFCHYRPQLPAPREVA